MANADSYSTWTSAAQRLDETLGLDVWRADAHSNAYEPETVHDHIARLRGYRHSGAFGALMDFLPESIYRLSGDLGDPSLYEVAHGGTKAIVNEYFQESAQSIRYLAEADLPGIDVDEKRRRLKHAAHSYGRSGLLLSGGATLGYYHLGVARALWTEDLLPWVLSGSSMGAIIASAVCTRNDDELATWFDEVGHLAGKALTLAPIHEVVANRAVMRQDALERQLRAGIVDLTFAEAFEKSGRVLNISVSPTRRRQKPRVLNHRTAPDVLIIEACMASAAVPGLFKPVTLKRRTASGRSVAYLPTEQWSDGSLTGDVPKRRLSRLQNVNHFIVSQTNPHVLPFVKATSGSGHLSRFAGLAGLIARGQSKAWLGLAREIGLFTPVDTLVEGANAFLNQDYSGDINIHPRFEPSLYLRMFANPDMELLNKFVLEGQRATWPKIEIIRNQTAIGRTLQQALNHLTTP